MLNKQGFPKGTRGIFSIILMILLFFLSCTETVVEEGPSGIIVAPAEPVTPDVQEPLIPLSDYPFQVQSSWLDGQGYGRWNALSGFRLQSPGVWAVPGGPGWLVYSGKDLFAFSREYQRAVFSAEDALWDAAFPVIPQRPPFVLGSNIIQVVAGYGVIALDSRTGETVWQRIRPDVLSFPVEYRFGTLIIPVKNRGLQVVRVSDGEEVLSVQSLPSHKLHWYGNDLVVILDSSEASDSLARKKDWVPLGGQNGSGTLFTVRYGFDETQNLSSLDFEPVIQKVIGGCPYPGDSGWMLYVQDDQRSVRGIHLELKVDETGQIDYSLEEVWNSKSFVHGNDTVVVSPVQRDQKAWPLVLNGNNEGQQVFHGGTGLYLGTLNLAPGQLSLGYGSAQNSLTRIMSVAADAWVDDRTFLVFWPEGFGALRTPGDFLVPVRGGRGARTIMPDKDSPGITFLYDGRIADQVLDDRALEFQVEARFLPLEFALEVEHTQSYRFESTLWPASPIRVQIVLDGGVVYDNATHVRLESQSNIVLEKGRLYQVRIDWAGGEDSLYKIGGFLLSP